MSPSPLTKTDWLIALSLAALTLVAGSWRMAPGVCGVYHDDAIYVSTAKALAQGDGYRLIDVPGEPRQTKYPVIYPALLAAVWKVWPAFPSNLVAMQGLTLLTMAAAIAATYLYLVRFDYFSRGISAGAALICATAPTFLYFGVQTMAEMPFALLSIAAMWGVECACGMRSAERGENDGRPFALRNPHAALVGVLLALPFLCRTIGVTIIIAGMGLLWWQRRPLQWTMVGVAAVALPWILWSLAGRGHWDHSPVDGYYTDYVGCWSSTGIAMLPSVAFWNSLMIARGSGEYLVEGLSALSETYLGPGRTLILAVPLGLVPWLAMTGGLKRGRILPWMLAAYLAVMLVWSWPPYRFLVPVLPFLAAYALSAAAAGTARLPSGHNWQKAGAVALVIVTIANGMLVARHAQIIAQTGYPLVAVTDPRTDWQASQRMFHWIEQHSQPGDVVGGGLDSMVALYTGRQAFRPFVYQPGELFYGQRPRSSMEHDLAAILESRRPRYVVVMPMPGFVEERPYAEAIARILASDPQRLTVAYQDADPRFIVYEVHRLPPRPADVAQAP